MDKKVNFGKVVKLLCLSLLVLIAILWVFDKPDKYEEPRSERIADLVLKYWIPKTEAGVGPSGFSDSDAECVIIPDEPELLIEFKELPPSNDVALLTQETSGEIKSKYKVIGFLSINIWGKCINNLPMDEIREIAANKAMKAGADAIEEEGLIAKRYKNKGSVEGVTFMYSLYKKNGHDPEVIKLENSTVVVPCEMKAHPSLLDENDKFDESSKVYLAPKEQEDLLRKGNFGLIGYISIVVKGECVKDTEVEDTFDVVKEEAMKMGADVVTIPEYSEVDENEKFYFYWCYKQMKKSSYEAHEKEDYYDININRRYEI